MKNDKLHIMGMHNGATPSVFQNAAKLRASMTKTELILWEYLKNKPMGFKFRRQHPISGYVLDFIAENLAPALKGGFPKLEI